MKTTKTITGKHSKLFFLGLFFSFFLVSVSTNAQTKIKGVVKGQTETKKEALNGANIYLKGTTIGTSTNKKGEFTFPKTLKAGDVLVFTYLGFVKKSIKINENTKTLNVILLEDSNQMLGALNINKRYKSKRNKPTN